MDRDAWCAAIHRVATERLNVREQGHGQDVCLEKKEAPPSGPLARVFLASRTGAAGSVQWLCTWTGRLPLRLN